MGVLLLLGSDCDQEGWSQVRSVHAAVWEGPEQCVVCDMDHSRLEEQHLHKKGY